MLTGASVVFFAVFGYDALTTAAEKARHAQRDLPRAVLLSLAIAMVLYVIVSLVITSITYYSNPGGETSVSDTFAPIALHWLSIISCAAIMLLRVRWLDLQRNFRTRWVWFTAPLDMVFSVVLIYGLPWITYERFLIWMAVGCVIYFSYGMWHSKLAPSRR